MQKIHVFFISNTFISNAGLKLGKIKQKLSITLRLNLLLFENYSLFSCTLSSSSKSNRRYSKKCTKNKYVFLNEVIWLMTMKMRLKMKNRSHRYSINMLTIKCVSVYINGCMQHLSNIWNSVNEEVKQHIGWVEKERCLL